MSSPLQTEAPSDFDGNIASIDPLMNMLNTLVPPENVEIQDIFNNQYTCPTSVSARSQIKVMREFDKIKNLELGDIGGDNKSIIDTIMKIAVNEEVLETLSKCFSVAHPKILKTAISHAEKEGIPYESGHSAAIDLFALEEIVTAIVPLFLRLARRTGQALRAIGNQVPA